MSSRWSRIILTIFTPILLLSVLAYLERDTYGPQKNFGWRLDDMARGAPDYSNAITANPLHRLDDMAELAARLGSPVTHDRAGQVIYVDTFESGIPGWDTVAEGTGSSVSVSTEDARLGAFSVKLVAGSDGNRSAQMARSFPYPVLNQHGLVFSVKVDTNVEYLIWTLAHRDGTDEHQYQCMYIPADEKIVATIAGYVSVDAMTNVNLYTQHGLFHNIKLVANFADEQYMRLVVNERAVSLATLDEYVFANATTPHLIVIITLYGKAGANGTAFIDDVIITQNEP